SVRSSMPSPDPYRQKLLFMMTMLVSIWEGCAGAISAGTHSPAPVLFSETFEDVASVARHWVADFPSSRGQRVQFRRADDDHSTALELANESPRSDVAVRHAIDVTNMRGQRVRLSVRARMSAPGTTVAVASFALDHQANMETYSDAVEIRLFSSNSL